MSDHWGSAPNDTEEWDDHSDCEQCTGYSPYDDEEETRADIIRRTINGMVADFLYYKRKEDESLPRGAIEEAVKSGEFTVEDIVATFENELRAGLS